MASPERGGELSGKVALVTGANRGIGEAIALELARMGATVAGTARRPEDLDHVNEMLEEYGGFGLGLDLKDRHLFKDALIEVEGAAEDSLSILVNNAGITMDGPSLGMGPEKWDPVIAVDLSAPHELTRLAMRSMRKKDYGRVVTISSVVGLTGNRGQANYAAAKAGIIGWNKTLVKEYEGTAVTFNVVAPGYIETDMTAGLPDEVKATMIEHTPSRRSGKVEDVAYVVGCLVSPRASFQNGVVLRVDGGLGV
jgi:3-oxoacyl-[acyl-carrier protein] reductase